MAAAAMAAAQAGAAVATAAMATSRELLGGVRSFSRFFFFFLILPD